MMIFKQPIINNYLTLEIYFAFIITLYVQKYYLIQFKRATNSK